MSVSRSRHVRAIHPAAAFTAAVAFANSALAAQTPSDKRPMTFLDQQNMRQIGSPAPSPDKKSLLYTISIPDWGQARRQTATATFGPDDELRQVRGPGAEGGHQRDRREAGEVEAGEPEGAAQ